MLATTAFRALTIPAISLAMSVPSALGQQLVGPPKPDDRTPTRFEIAPSVRLTVKPLVGTATPHGDGMRDGDDGGIAGTCPPVVVTHTTNPALFTGPASFNLQAGMVETEIAAVTFVAPPEAFPLTIRTIEMVWARVGSNQQQITQYSVMFFQGTPNTAGFELVDSFASPDDLPQIVINPSPQAAGVNVQITIDPGDPDQIIIEDDGSHTFTVGFRIDDHNSEPTGPGNCPCPPPVGGLGTLPFFCCPPTPSLNTFPGVDTDGLAQPTRNWAFVRDCPGATGFPCAAPQGWRTASQLGITGDWALRTTYEPFDCLIPTGACCLNGGTQCVPGLTQNDCTAVSGSWQGAGTNCTNGCPPPTGACCINGNCSQLTEAACAAAGGVFGAVGMPCGANTCSNSVCCVPSTQQCVQTSQANCAFASGVFHPGTTCATFVCFPMGSCCLEDGSCSAGPMTPAACQALGGTFAGHNSTCATANCQPPVGVCCFGSNCAPSATMQAACTGLGGTWAYPLSACVAFACPYCPQDIERDGAVDINDLLAVINNWGPCNNCAADIDPAPFGDNQVSINDLLGVINNWGTCP